MEEGGCACGYHRALVTTQTDFLFMSQLYLVSMSQPSQAQSGTDSHVGLERSQ